MNGLAFLLALIFAVQLDSTKPYMVGLRTTSDGQNYCAGVLISPKYVLTSNKCYPAMIRFNSGRIYEAQYAVIGSKYLKGSHDGETIKVSNRIRHPEFNMKTFEFDFLLLELALASSRTPVTMVPVRGPFVFDGNRTALGWGSAATLSATKMAIVHTTYCDGTDNLDDWNLCLKSANKTSSCNINYGSPVITIVANGTEFLNGVLVNVTSCQQSSAPLKADNLGMVRYWIKSITGR